MYNICLFDVELVIIYCWYISASNAINEFLEQKKKPFMVRIEIVNYSEKIVSKLDFPVY